MAMHSGGPEGKCTAIIILTFKFWWGQWGLGPAYAWDLSPIVVGMHEALKVTLIFLSKKISFGNSVEALKVRFF